MKGQLIRKRLPLGGLTETNIVHLQQLKDVSGTQQKEGELWNFKSNYRNNLYGGENHCRVTYAIPLDLRIEKSLVSITSVVECL